MMLSAVRAPPQPPAPLPPPSALQGYKEAGDAKDEAYLQVSPQQGMQAPCGLPDSRADAVPTLLCPCTPPPSLAAKQHWRGLGDAALAAGRSSASGTPWLRARATPRASRPPDPVPPPSVPCLPSLPHKQFHNPRTFEDFDKPIPNFRKFGLKAGEVPKFFDGVLSVGGALAQRPEWRWACSALLPKGASGRVCTPLLLLCRSSNPPPPLSAFAALQKRASDSVATKAAWWDVRRAAVEDAVGGTRAVRVQSGRGGALPGRAGKGRVS